MAGPPAEPILWQLEDLLQCMICFEPYRSPKMLKCGHTFCSDCLAGYLKTYLQQRSAIAGKLPCPTCRDLTTLPPTGVPGLRNDFKVQKIENLFRTMNVRQRASATECSACHAQKKSAPAAVYCFNCAKSYCDRCLRQHAKNALFQDHKVVNRAAPIPGVSADLECKLHPGELGKYLCRTCDTVICTLCIMNEHSDHDASEIPVVVQQQQDEIKNLTDMVQVKSKELQKWASELDPLRKAFLESCQTVEAAVKDRSRQLMESAKRQEVQMLQELKKLRQEKLDALEKERERVKYNISRMKSMGEFAAALSSSRSVRAMGTHEEILQRMRTIMDTGSSIQVHPEGGQIMSVLAFLPGRHEVDFGRYQDARVSPEQLARSAAAAQAPGPGQGPQSRPTPALGQGSSDGRSKPKLLLRIHQHGSNPGQLRDPLAVACTLQGELIVAEWGNKRLQVFDSTGRSVRLIGSGLVEPQGVAVTHRGNIIISDAPQKRMQVFAMSGASITKWGLGKFFSPCGLAVSPNGNYIITDTGDNSVNIYKGDLTCIRRFGSKGPRDTDFDNPLYVATGQHNEIIVSDSDNHCVKVFDSSGQFVRKIGGSPGSADGQLKFPRGVCTDADGSIVVADRSNDRVCLFSKQGRFVRHLLTKEDGVKDPYAVGITVNGNLVVTESTATRAEIKVFRF